MALSVGGRRWIVRAAAILGVAGVAGGIAAVVIDAQGDGRPSADPAAPARAFMAAWHAGDYRAMYGLVAPRIRRNVTYRRFAHEYHRAVRTAEITAIRQVGTVQATGTAATVSVVAGTAAFGRVYQRFEIPLTLLGGRYRVSARARRWP
jgi:hypothetical protein